MYIFKSKQVIKLQFWLQNNLAVLKKTMQNIWN